jgi:hypothetical protein
VLFCPHNAEDPRMRVPHTEVFKVCWPEKGTASDGELETTFYLTHRTTIAHSGNASGGSQQGLAISSHFPDRPPAAFPAMTSGNDPVTEPFVCGEGNGKRLSAGSAKRQLDDL